MEEQVLTIDSMEQILNINSLPNEIILKIFSNLTQNELCRISRVCKKWNEFTKSPVLWKEVDIKVSKVFLNNADINENILTFVRKLPFNVTQLKIDFSVKSFRNGRLNFKEFCMKLNERSPNLHRLYLRNAYLSVNLPSVVNLCSKFLPNIKILILPDAYFNDNDQGSEHDGSSKIEIFDISFTLGCQIGRSGLHCISNMPCLKKLSFYSSRSDYTWFQNSKDFSFLQRLEYFNLGYTYIDSATFNVLRIHARNLTELFLCGTDVLDSDLIFNNAFLLLKSICLKECIGVSWIGIKSLLQSCQSLENVYADDDIAEVWDYHPYNTANIVGVVKSIEVCDHHEVLLRC